MMVRSVFQWLAVLWMSHLVEMSSSLLVSTVSHEAQENRRVPPMCWMKIRPIFTSDKRNHTNIRIGIQSQLQEGSATSSEKGAVVGYTIFIRSLNDKLHYCSDNIQDVVRIRQLICINYSTMKGSITIWSKENLSGVGRILFNRAVGTFQLVALGKFG